MPSDNMRHIRIIVLRLSADTTSCLPACPVVLRLILTGWQPSLKHFVQRVQVTVACTSMVATSAAAVSRRPACCTFTASCRPSCAVALCTCSWNRAD